MKKILVIFDGSNFYHGVKRLSKNIHLTNFNYRKLAQNITGFKDIQIEYCVGEIKQNHQSPKTKRLYAGQQALFYHLTQQRIKIQKGYMLKDGAIYHEKVLTSESRLTFSTAHLKIPMIFATLFPLIPISSLPF